MTTGRILALAALGLTAGSCATEAPRSDRSREGSQGGASLAIWIVDDSTKIRPDSDLGPASLAAGDPVRLYGAGGETVAFQLAIESPVDRDRIEVAVGPLDNGGGRIEANRLDLFLETYLFCPEVDAKIVALGAGSYPDPLVPLWERGPGSREIAAPLKLSAGERSVLWVDVTIPRETPSGTYRGALTLRPSGGEALSIPLELERYDFDLPRRPSLRAFVPLYTTRLVRREGIEGGFGDEASLALVRRYLEMANAHRFVTELMDYQPKTRWNEQSGALESIDWTDYDRLYSSALDGTLFPEDEPVRIWKVGGFVWWGARPGDPPNFGGTKSDAEVTPAHRRALGEYAREIRRHFDEKGWTAPELFFYMIDEPDLKVLPRAGELVASYGRAIHEAGAGILHLATMAPTDSKPAIGGVDIWATWGAGYVPRDMQARQSRGEQAWFYQKGEPFLGGHLLNQEGLGLRSWPWIARRYDVDGIFLWVGNFWNEDPYREANNWTDDLLGNGTLFYPGAMLPTIGHPAIAGPVSSVRMKALRRGLYDADYFELLRSLGGDPAPIVESVVRSALNEGGWSPIWKHPRWAQHGDWSHDPKEWDGAIREVADEISRRLAP